MSSHENTAALILAACLIAGCSDNNHTAAPPTGGGGPGGGTPTSRCAVARVAQNSGDLVPGPVARSTIGDLVIENQKIRAIVQKAGRNWYNISQFGGNIIDALPKAADGSLLGQDHFEESVLGTNIESAPNFQSVEVLNPGGETTGGGCNPAIIRATGPDDLLDFVNGSSAIRQIQLQGVPLSFPPSADDIDLPLTIQSDYILNADENTVRIITTLSNDTAADVKLYLAEYVNGSGEVEQFQHGYGFGEPLAIAPCDLCNYIAYAGHEGGSGVSYGIIHTVPVTSGVSTSGVSVLLYGRDVVDIATTPEPLIESSPTAGPNFTVPANGQMLFVRFFAVGNGTVSSIVDARNRILNYSTGTVQGTVSDANGPVKDAEISMLSSGRDGFPQGRGPVLNVVNAFRTDANGQYSGTYPAGRYELRINMPGRLAATPATANITVTSGQNTRQNFNLPSASGIRVLVKDSNGLPIPAKVQLLGAQQGPDAGEPQNQDQLFGSNALGVFTGVFGDALADVLAPGIALSEFAVLDSGAGAVTVGDTGVVHIEPGQYQVSVSRGPRFNEFIGNVTVRPGEVAAVNAVLTQVIETPNHVYGDFHVHSFDSPDSEVTNRERVSNYLAEGMDFFTPSDHGLRADFGPVIADMQADTWLATAPSSEVTTFDYGHFNFWPVGIETDSDNDDFPNNGHSTSPKISRGSTDWGNKAPAGKDFPSSGNYVLAPDQIADSAAADPLQPGRNVVRQINHLETHFGLNGLHIDTGRNPPRSFSAANAIPPSSAGPADKRLDPSYVNGALGGNNYYGDNFDTLELWIGVDGLLAQNEHFLGENLGDWFNLLNQGRHRTAVANSDTHDRRQTSLHTRNVISVPASLLSSGSANPGAISADPHTVGDSIRAGLSSMSNAPFLTIKASSGGNTAGLELSDSFGTQDKPLPLAAPTDTVSVAISVQSPEWAQYDQILVFRNGETQRHVDELGLAPTSPARYKVCAPSASSQLNFSNADFTRTIVPGVQGGRKYQTDVAVPLIANAGQDFWIVVMARGTDGNSVPMWPVVPNDFVNAGALSDRSAADRGVQALAMSNPIYIDANNNGRWDPPGVRTHQGTRLPPDQCPNGLLPPH